MLERNFSPKLVIPLHSRKDPELMGWLLIRNHSKFIGELDLFKDVITSPHFALLALELPDVIIYGGNSLGEIWKSLGKKDGDLALRFIAIPAFQRYFVKNWEQIYPPTGFVKHIMSFEGVELEEAEIIQSHYGAS